MPSLRTVLFSNETSLQKWSQVGPTWDMGPRNQVNLNLSASFRFPKGFRWKKVLENGVIPRLIITWLKKTRVPWPKFGKNSGRNFGKFTQLEVKNDTSTSNGIIIREISFENHRRWWPNTIIIFRWFTVKWLNFTVNETPAKYHHFLKHVRNFTKFLFLFRTTRHSETICTRIHRNKTLPLLTSK